MKTLIRIPYFTCSQRSIWINLLVLVLCVISPVKSTSAKKISDIHTIPAFNGLADVCQQAANTSTWNLRLELDYNSSLRYATNLYTSQQSVTLDLILGNPTRSETEVVWSVIQSRGTGKIVDDVIYKHTDWYEKIRGEGSVFAIGLMRLDLMSCTYDLLVQPSLKTAIRTNPDGLEQIQFQRIGEVYVIERQLQAIPLRSQSIPVLEWSGMIPAISNEIHRQNDLFLGDGIAASSIRAAYRNCGQVRAGNANVSWFATSPDSPNPNPQAQQAALSPVINRSSPIHNTIPCVLTQSHKLATLDVPCVCIPHMYNVHRLISMLLIQSARVLCTTFWGKN